MVTIALSIGLTEPIGEWPTLVRAIRSWCNREDWTDVQVTEFIALAEARFNRVLRVPDMEEVATTTLTTGNNNLPLDLLAVKAVYVDNYILPAMTVSALIATYGTVAGIPAAYCLLDSGPRKIRLGPQPASPTPVTLVYYKKIEAINENNADNWLLGKHPDLYLWGCLLAAEFFLANDERLPLLKAAYDEVLGELCTAGIRDQYGAAPLVPMGIGQVSGARA
jgi:hypothetical protein